MAIPKRQKVLASVNPSKDEVTRTGNPMDSSAPTTRRGKERETPKKKRPSALRKVTVTISPLSNYTSLDHPPGHYQRKAGPSNRRQDNHTVGSS